MDARERAFLDAICADPGDLMVRLVFADWLGENGQSVREEFARVQIELFGIDRTVVGVQAATAILESRERKLLTPQSFWDWFGAFCNLRWTGSPAVSIRDSDLMCEVGQFNGDDHERWRLWTRNGFVERISCTYADWMKHGPAIVRQQPVTEVQLTDKHPVGASFPGRTSEDEILFSFLAWRGSRDGNHFSLPEFLEKLMYLDGKSRVMRRNDLLRRLSWACVVWARGEHTVTSPGVVETIMRRIEAMDPECPDCDSRGHAGGYRGPEFPCPNCRGLGRILPAIFDQQREQFNASSS